MPWRFGLTFALFVVVNGSLTFYQYLVGQAVHDVERGRAVVRLVERRSRFQQSPLLGGRSWWRRGGASLLAVPGGIASLITGQELLFRLRDSILVQVQRLDLRYYRATASARWSRAPRGTPIRCATR